MVGCYSWVPWWGAIVGVPLLGCHCWGAIRWGAIRGCHGGVLLLGCHGGLLLVCDAMVRCGC